MASTIPAQLFVLGDLADAKGKLGPAHSKATAAQMATATGIITDPRSYGRVGMTVSCVEDRLHRPDPRLAGGALCLGLVHNLIYGGKSLSSNLQALKAMAIRLALHDHCGALGLVADGFVQRELSRVNAQGYRLLGALGYNVPTQVRRRIAYWASWLPANYVDMDAVLKIVDEIDHVEGEHNAVSAAVSLESGVSFIGGPRLKHETGGLLSFAFDPWIAKPFASRIGATADDLTAAEALALVFTAQVFLALGGPDLWIALHR